MAKPLLVVPVEGGAVQIEYARFRRRVVAWLAQMALIAILSGDQILEKVNVVIRADGDPNPLYTEGPMDPYVAETVAKEWAARVDLYGLERFVEMKLAE